MRIAIVGGGVAGITAAYLLQRDHQVSLYEKNDYIGGHTHTITIPDGPDAGTPVDTGFIVFNDRTYPILNRLFRRLGVSIRKSDMSFGYFDEKSGFQYASSNLNSLFAQRRNLLAPGYWSMLAEDTAVQSAGTRQAEKGTAGRCYPRSVFTSIPVFRSLQGAVSVPHGGSHLVGTGRGGGPVSHAHLRTLF
jgi:predicted NAD/FAD-binding protein